MNKQGTVTIHDIARELNISASTVSRALNDNPRISKKTKIKIKELAKKMGYQPNLLASNLRSQKTNTIGIIIPLINRHYFSTFISGVEDYAFNTGYNIVISQSNDLLKKEQKVVQSMFSNRVDGIIVSISMQTDNFDHFNCFIQNKTPLVFFDRVVPTLDSHKIIVDNFKIGYEATKHLIEQGYKKIAHFAGPTVLHLYADRLKGYCAAMAEEGLEVPEDYIIQNKLTRIDGRDGIEQLLALPNPPDALVCGSGTSALSVLFYLKEQGINVPQDFGLVGASDEPASALVTPSVTSVCQPAYEMGKKAAELIIKEIEDRSEEGSYQVIEMEAKLVQRESSTRL